MGAFALDRIQSLPRPVKGDCPARTWGEQRTRKRFVGRQTQLEGSRRVEADECHENP